MDHISGVYRIKNTLDGKFYIGSSCDVYRRFKEHANRLNSKTHPNPYLQSAWVKHGSSNFIFEVLLVCPRTNLLMYEQSLIDGYKAVEYGYNLASVAGTRIGIKVSEETRKRMSIARKGKRPSPETRAKMSESGKKRVFSEQHRFRISQSQKARLASKEARDLVSVLVKGRKRTQESIQRMREAQRLRRDRENAAH